MKTSYYANLKNINQTQYTPVAISGDEGKLVGFEGKAMRSLSPYSFFRKWKENENLLEEQLKNKTISNDEYNRLKEQSEQDYIQKFYTKVLRPLDPQKVYNQLGKNAVILCFEKPTEFCHRFLVAGWLELSLGVQIDEYGFEKDKKVFQNKQRLKNEIKKQMQKEINMQKH